MTYYTDFALIAFGLLQANEIILYLYLNICI